MFGKRRRAASNPPQRAPPSASASLAATKAFVQNRESHTDLSSAAAAAALRTHVTTPTPVGATVTKRMARRGSVSSNGSSVRPLSGTLRRQSSSGSMTERSFRAASPASARGIHVEPNPPPVPPVPWDHLQQDGTAHRRASSLEPTYRGASPGPRSGGRGISLDRGASSTPVPGHQRQASQLAHVVEEEDTVRNSVNFSRPMSPGASVTKKPSPPTSHGWFGGPVVNQDAVQRMVSTSRPQTSSGVSAYDLQNAQQSIQRAVERPTKTHQVAQGAEGMRLNSGSMRAKPSGTAVQSRSFLPAATKPPTTGPVDPNSPDAVYDPSTRTFIRKQDAMAIHRELYQEPEQPTRQYVAQHVGDYHRQPLSPPQSGRGSPIPLVTRKESTTPQRRADPPRPATVIKTSETTARPRTPEPSVHTIAHSHSSEDFADAEIQPPRHSNVNHSLEKTASTGPDGVEDTSSSNIKKNQDSSYPYLVAPARLVPANTVTAQKPGSISPGQPRPISLSSQRSAHFAPGVVELTGVKHEPLARSVSPAKSALKSSPSVSRRSHSPVASDGRLTSKSGSSDASDAASDTGSQRRKKSVRVSFEQTSVIVSPVARAEVASSATQPGLNASKWSPIAEKDNEFEDFMKPRAALPVFGSIRDKKRRPPSEDEAEKVTETVTTPMSASIGSILEHSEASHDQALGNLVAHEPIPPQVTSVEGSGYHSDSSNEFGSQKHSDRAERWQLASVPEPKTLTLHHDKDLPSTGPISKQIIEVPQFALQPATPSPNERPEPKFQAMTLPGGWNEIEIETASSTKDKPVEPMEKPPPQKGQKIIFAEEEETTDDNSSVYSDAYEDLTDNEASFASIDALVRSPASPSSSGLLASKYAPNAAGLGPGKRGDDDTNSDGDSDVTTTQGWGATQKHWSGINAGRKDSQREESANHGESRAKAGADGELVAGRSKPDMKQTPPTGQNSEPQAGQTASKPLKSALKKTTTSQTIPAPEPKMRQSMRGPPPREAVPETHMRKSMRTGTSNTATRAEQTMRTSMRGSSDIGSRAQPQMRQSMRGADSPPSALVGLAASRHSMSSAELKPPRGALQKKHPQTVPTTKPRPQSMQASKQTTPTVPTYDSDSDASASSFQRTRARGRYQAGRMTMRGSMRQEPAPTMRPVAPAPKQVRAISPPGSPTPAIRKSMRSSSPTPEAVKSSRFSIRSLSPMGRFRSSKGSEVRPSSPTLSKPMPSFNKQPKTQKTQKQKAPVAQRAKGFTSRFADSSDDDDDVQPRHFQSRFADSDDEEPFDYKLPPGLAPVRGIPRTRDDDDSTDLEEEAEDTPAVAPAPTAQTGSTISSANNGTSTGQGSALASGSLRDSQYAPAAPSSDAGTPTKQKRGFFGIGKKKSFVSQAGSSELPAMPSDIPVPSPLRNRDLGLALTPIDEDRDFDTLSPSSQQSKRSPKLQRRSTPEWPLSPPPPIGGEVRPMSSDGVAPRRPRFAKRQSSQISNATAPIADAQGHAVSYGRTGKKKKFQGLRRVFGLND